MIPVLIDLHHLDMIGGIADPEVLELVNDFTSEIPDYLSRIENAIASGDSTQLREAAHSIRGVAGMLGFQLLAATAAEADINTPHADPHGWFVRLIRYCEETAAEWTRLKSGSDGGPS